MLLREFELERYVLRELPAERLAQLDERCASDPELAQQVAALRASNAEVLRAQPPELVAAQITRRQQARGQRRRLALHLLATAGVAAALVVASVREDDGGERTKGAARPALELWLSEARGPRLLRDGEEVSAGATVQLGYRAAGARYGVIGSIDGRGGATLHFPSGADGATALAAPPTLLDHAYQLDDAPRFERFFLVLAATPLAPKLIMAQLVDLAKRPDAATASLDVAGASVVSVGLVKP